MIKIEFFVSYKAKENRKCPALIIESISGGLFSLHRSAHISGGFAARPKSCQQMKVKAANCRQMKGDLEC